jgi:hypothetical protein
MRVSAGVRFRAIAPFDTGSQQAPVHIHAIARKRTPLDAADLPTPEG